MATRTGSTRIPHLLIGVQMFGLSGYAIHVAWTSDSVLWMAATSLFVLWAISVGLMSVAYSTAPHRFPWLRSIKKPMWKLRLPQVNRSAERLRQIGFEEIGVKEERTFLIGLQTREFWHPQHRTFASLTTSIPAGFVPSVTFITQGADGRIVYTGRSVAHRRRHLVARAGVGSTVEARFEDHLRALKGEELELMPAPTPEHHDYRELGSASPTELMKQRLELTREWYVVSFASDEQWEKWQKGSARLSEARS